MTSQDLTLTRELHKLDAAEQEFRLHDTLTSLASVRQQARETFGPVQHGASVNIPLADYYRELDEIERAARNALNALTVLTGERHGMLGTLQPGPAVTR